MNDTVKQPRHFRKRFISFFSRLFRPSRDFSGQKDSAQKVSSRKLKSSAATQICLALPGYLKSKSIAEAEKWFIRELLALQKKQLKHRSDFKINGSSTLLVNFYTKSFEISQIYESFIQLKNSYAEQGSDRDALRMLELAAIFRRPSEEEFKWGLAIAARDKIIRGMWLGEASYLYTTNGYNEDCKIILEESAKQGNELSEFILSHC